MPTGNQDKLNKIHRLAKLGSVPIYEEIQSLEDKITTTEKELTQKDQELEAEITVVSEAQNSLKAKLNNHIEEMGKILPQKLSRDDLEALKPELKGDKGDNYILTPQDKQEIADKVKVPVVEKVEKIEVIREQPIITNEIREVAIKDTPEEITDKLNVLENVLEPKVLVGWKDIQQNLRDLNARSGASRAGWGAHPLVIQNEGTIIDKVARNINFTGDGISVSRSPSGVIEVNVSVGAGGGLAVEIPSGAVDGVNVTFTVLNTPLFVVADGMIRVENQGYTYSAGTITMNPLIPPTEFIRSFYSI
jgi:hypothetical protein